MAEKKTATEVAPEEEVKDTGVALKGNMELAGFDSIMELEEFTGKDDVNLGLEDLDSSDIKIPVYQLLQSNSDAVSKRLGLAGQYYNTLDKKSSDDLIVCLLTVVKTRVRWEGKYRKGAKPICRSFNGRVGVGNPGIECAKCQYKEWDNVNNEKPQCSMGYNWLAIDLRTNKVFRFTAISSGFAPTRDFLTKYKTDSFEVGGRRIPYKKYPLFGYKVRLSTILEENDKGTFYIPHYDIIGSLSKDDANQAKIIIETYKEMLQQDLEKDISAHAGASVDDSGYEYVQEDTTQGESDPF